MKKLNLFLLFAGAISASLSIAQSGPGGVGSSTNNSFWLDANDMNLANGANVTVLSDVSGNGNDFLQSVVNDQPVFTTGAVNGLPVVRFDGVDDNLISNSIPALETNNLTWFVVYKKSSLETNALIGGNYVSNTKQWQSYANSNANFVISSQYSSGSFQGVSYIDDVANYNFFSTHITPTSMETYKEGVLQSSIVSTYTAPTGNNFIILGRMPKSAAYFLNGDIAEVFIYNSSLNDLERTIIENYLGAKYNLTIPNDYFSFQNTHNIGVIGIGDDGTNVHTTSVGNDILQLSNPTTLSVNEYMFIGHTNNSLTEYTTTDLPASVSTHTRYTRTWRVDETGDLGNVNLSFDLTGGVGFAIPSTYRILVDDDGDFSNATVLIGTYNTGIQTYSIDIDLIPGQYFTLSGEFADPTAIHSIASGDWSDPTVWDCSCVPTANDTVYIDNSDAIGVNVDANTYNLFVAPNATLKMTDNFNLSLEGDFILDGTAVLTNGKVSFIGDIDQTISAAGNSLDINNIEINNSNTSNINFINGKYILNGTLTPNKGVMIVDPGATFIINSTLATTGGRIGQVLPSFSFVGTFTVKRFLPAGVAGKRTIASPVIGADLSMWDADIFISGSGFPDGCAYSSDGCYYSAKEFHGGELGVNYIDVVDPNRPLLNGVGYELFIGDDLTTFSGATLSSVGTLNSSLDVIVAPPNVGSAWNIIGNPYASPITFATMNFSYMSDYYYVFDAQSDSYQWYYALDNTSSVPELANGIIAMGQGFWVRNGGSSSVVFKQQQKVTTTGTFIKSAQPNNSLFLELTQEGTTYKNVINVGFNKFGYDGVDSLDVPAFLIGEQKSSSIFINVEGELLARNILESNGNDKLIDLSIKILNEGYYTLTAAKLENLLGYNNVTLIDYLTGDKISFNKQNSYTFFSEEGDFQRFKLVLSNDLIVDNNTSIFDKGANEEGIVINQLGNAINIVSTESVKGLTEIKIINLLGQDVVYTKSLSLLSGDNMVFLPNNFSGIYIVTVTNSKGIVTKKIML